MTGLFDDEDTRARKPAPVIAPGWVPKFGATGLAPKLHRAQPMNGLGGAGLFGDPEDPENTAEITPADLLAGWRQGRMDQ